MTDLLKKTEAHRKSVEKWQKTNRDKVNAKQKRYREKTKAEREAFKMIVNHFTKNNVLDREQFEKFIEALKEMVGGDDE